jgi:hypothetical protein
MARYIDPPSGWKFGFPKPIPKDTKDVREWLIQNGYPEKLITELGDHFYCRHWERPDDEENKTEDNE